MKEKFDRRQGLGGSDIAAIMGVSKWRTPMDVYFEKTAEIPLEFVATEVMERGLELEKFVLADYAEQTGQELEVDIPTIRNPDYPYLYAHIDAKVLGKNIVVEAKTTNDSISSWIDIPIYYKTQVALYCILTNAECADVHVWFNYHMRKTFRYERDKELEDKILVTSKEFWNRHIIDNIPPLATTVHDLEKLYSKPKPSTIIADESMEALIIELKVKRDAKKLAEEQYEKSQMAIMEKMGNVENIENCKGRTLISWRNNSILDESGSWKSRRVFRICS